MPLHRRIPKRGFRSLFRREYQIVNIGDLERCDSSVPVTPEVLAQNGLIRSAARPVKILGDGTLHAPRVVQAHAFSAKAREALERLGGKAEVIGTK
jgi:large subunit ribosomal protein L15